MSATLEPPCDAVVADITPPPEEIGRFLLAKLGLTRQTERVGGSGRAASRPVSQDTK